MVRVLFRAGCLNACDSGSNSPLSLSTCLLELSLVRFITLELGNFCSSKPDVFRVWCMSML